jgi:hypothetical protein
MALTLGLLTLANAALFLVAVILHWGAERAGPCLAT